MKERNKFGTSGDPSWHPHKGQGERVRGGDRGNLSDGSESIRGAKPLPDLENSRMEHLQHGRVVKKSPPTGVFVPPVDAPRTSYSGDDWNPASRSWRPADGRGVREDTGKGGGRFPRERKPNP